MIESQKFCVHSFIKTTSKLLLKKKFQQIQSRTCFFFNYLPSESKYFYCTRYGCTCAEVTLNKEKMKERCRLKLYIRKPNPPTGVMNFFSGQHYIKCPIHEVPLCSDFVGTTFFVRSKNLFKVKMDMPTKKVYNIVM